MALLSATTPDAETTLMSLCGIEKTFGRTRALAGATIDLREAEIHALLGANGAGKSTLSKVIAGHLQPDAGEIRFRGKPIRLRSTRDALNVGIAIVMQETTLAPDLSVLENIFLPELGTKGLLSRSGMVRRATAILEDLGQADSLPLNVTVRHLSSAQRQLVEIAKALALEAELIIFDEPTASLSAGEVERLFDVMTRLKDAGKSLVFVSHRLEEVLAITDRVTVMREGATIASRSETKSLTQSDIIRLMVGRDLGAVYENKAIAADAGNDSPVILEVRNLAAPPAVMDVSFSVRQGEIVGLGGLVGAGRSEIAETIFGLRRRSSGTVRISGSDVNFRRPTDAIRAGVGLVPEDRRVQNIVPDLSVRENLLLAHLGAHRGFGLGYKKRQEKIDALLKLLDMPAHRVLDASMLNFSGGMQQKIIIARWLLLEPRVLILDEPTKGVDIGTRQSIYEILRKIAADGVAIVMISSDFQELLGVANRIVVISDGYSIADIPSAVLDEEKLTLLAAPRTSMKRNTTLLEDLAADYGGTGFWAVIDDNGLICLNSVTRRQASDTGFQTGDAVRFDETAIPDALSRRRPEFVTEADGSRSTIVAPIRSHRNHDMGWIGLTVPGPAPSASSEEIKQRIETLNG